MAFFFTYFGCLFIKLKNVVHYIVLLFRKLSCIFGLPRTLRLKECNANSEINISYLQDDVTQKHYVLVSCYEDYDHFHYK